MLTLLMILFIALTVVSYKKYEEAYASEDYVYLGVSVCAVLITILLFMGEVGVGMWFFSSMGAEEKVVLVEESNSILEEQIGGVIKDYLRHEEKVYEEISPKEAVAMAMAYPELASNEIVKEQINTYRENQKAVLDYKKKAVDIGIARWWLFFGGK